MLGPDVPLERRALVRLLIQDGALDVADLNHPGVTLDWENKILEIPAGAPDRFMDGPSSRRIAVVDFDSQTSESLPPPAIFTTRQSSKMRGYFEHDEDPDSPTTLAINAFGIAYQTVRMFEGAQALGRPVSWAFDGNQLLVVPRAGQWANSLYERETRSLQFFSFRSQSGNTIHTAMSRDIVAHECGHALLDAVVPSLYDSQTPQSKAIHESVADQIALLMALDSAPLRQGVLNRSQNSLAGPNAFNSIAVQFGRSRPGPSGMERTALRDLANVSTLPELKLTRPHVLSTLLSGILYDTLKSIFDDRFDVELTKPRTNQSRFTPATQAANAALGTAHVLFRRLLLRGIDYLPPGELTFADLGKAVLAADRAISRGQAQSVFVARQQSEFAQRFVDRMVVSSASDLDSPHPSVLNVPTNTLTELKDSDWAAYGYIERHRRTLGIPSGTSFTVLPRVDSVKAIGPIKEGARPTQRELIIKVGWNHLEDSPYDVLGASKRIVPTGLTVSLRWEDGRCLALVRSDVTSHDQSDQRDELLRVLDGEGWLDHDGQVGVHVSGDIGRLLNTQRLLHLSGWDDE